MSSVYESFVREIVAMDEDELSLDILKRLKRDFSRDKKLSAVPSNIQLLRAYHSLLKQNQITPRADIEQLLTKRPVRSMSGIVSVQVLTKPFWCPGKCIFCPNDFTMPKSYINTEPGAMRALLNNFDPIKQVYNRLLSLTLTGHKTDKIEMIVLGGTWDVYPQDYKENFVKSLYDACNTFPQYYDSVILSDGSGAPHASRLTAESTFSPEVPSQLEESLLRNESAKQRIIGLTVETRPEYVNDENCQFWRRLGVTRLEMGVQSTNDEVLEANKRGHDTNQSRKAVDTLRRYGFKFSLHVMPGLYGSDEEKDMQTFKDLYTDSFFKPDEIKFYPTSVIPNTELYDLYAAGEYKPLDTETIQRLVRKTFWEVIPPYTRIKRLIRDIPSTEIVAGSSVTNLAQLTHQDLKKQMREHPQLRKLYTKLYTHSDSVDRSTLTEYVTSRLYEHKNMALSQEVYESMIKSWTWGDSIDTHSYRNFVSLDTRSREIRHKYKKANGLPAVSSSQETLVGVVRAYVSSVGIELFISYEDSLGYLYGFVRLCLPFFMQTRILDLANQDSVRINASGVRDTREEMTTYQSMSGIGPSYAMIRELHVYGQLQSLQSKKYKATQGESVQAQHRGFGGKLLSLAEEIASSAGFQYLSVISGIGVKPYYRKHGYVDEGTYVVKPLKS